jgi:hypothetical protein
VSLGMFVVVTEVVDMMRSLVKETEAVRCVRVSLECLANAAVGSPTVNLSTKLVGECIDLDLLELLYCTSADC